jgi:quercetin dioxygenase-like cupin family protein
MKEFPEFMRNPANAIDPGMQSEGVQGYVFDGADGSQMAFWTTSFSGKSTQHIHPYDEYLVVVQGQCTVIIDGESNILDSGDELHIPAGIPHSTRFQAGTRTIHAFGGQRARRLGYQ